MQLGPFGGQPDEGEFDPEGSFVPDHLPEPGPFLVDHDVLEGDGHVQFHGTTRELFEQRGVYDATFGYNLARLNRDRRHPEAGFRYAEDTDDRSVLRAEFTPTTPFCPQSDSLTKGAFRAWNGLADRHDYREVRVRVSPVHQRSTSINRELQKLESSGEPDESTNGAADDPGSGVPF